MLLLLLSIVSRCTNGRNIVPYLGGHGIHIRVAIFMLTDAIFSVFFINVGSQVFENGLLSISRWLVICDSRAYLIG